MWLLYLLINNFLCEETMLHFKLDANKQIAEVVNQYPEGQKVWASNSADGSGWMTRHDFVSMDHAAQIAKSATECTGKLHLPVDSGSGVWPRFDVIEAPAIGEAVSYGFNGDYYPCGHIKSISESFRVITTTGGQKFYRRRESATWKFKGIWSLVDGHRKELNPSF
jgi:hypothetical protein